MRKKASSPLAYCSVAATLNNQCDKPISLHTRLTLMMTTTVKCYAALYMCVCMCSRCGGMVGVDCGLERFVALGVCVCGCAVGMCVDVAY